jgi:hypothetical protein
MNYTGILVLLSLKGAKQFLIRRKRMRLVVIAIADSFGTHKKMKGRRSSSGSLLSVVVVASSLTSVEGQKIATCSLVSGPEYCPWTKSACCAVNHLNL